MRGTDGCSVFGLWGSLILDYSYSMNRNCSLSLFTLRRAGSEGRRSKERFPGSLNPVESRGGTSMKLNQLRGPIQMSSLWLMCWIALFSMIGCFVENAKAEDTSEQRFRYEIVDGAVTLEGVKEEFFNHSSFSIPRQIEGMDVVCIGSSVFAFCDSLASVTIPDSVKSIGYHAFEGRSKLTSVTIPDSVKYLGSSAFQDCFILGSVTIGNSVKRIGSRAFYYCESLPSVTIGDSVTEIGYEAFGRSALRSVTMSDSVKSIKDFAFYNCTSLHSVTIGNSVKSIGEHAFSRCTSLASVTIPDSVESIGNFAFYKCTSLTSATVPDSVTMTGYLAFQGCPWQPPYRPNQ